MYTHTFESDYSYVCYVSFNPENKIETIELWRWDAEEDCYIKHLTCQHELFADNYPIYESKYRPSSRLVPTFPLYWGLSNGEWRMMRRRNAVKALKPTTLKVAKKPVVASVDVNERWYMPSIPF